MATKQLNQVEITIVKDISTSEVRAEVRAVCWSEELETQFLVVKPMMGAEGVIEGAIDALRIEMANDGKHDVIDAPPPPSPPPSAEELEG